MENETGQVSGNGGLISDSKGSRFIGPIGDFFRRQHMVSMVLAVILPVIVALLLFGFFESPNGEAAVISVGFGILLTMHFVSGISLAFALKAIPENIHWWGSEVRMVRLLSIGLNSVDVLGLPLVLTGFAVGWEMQRIHSFIMMHSPFYSKTCSSRNFAVLGLVLTPIAYFMDGQKIEGENILLVIGACFVVVGSALWVVDRVGLMIIASERPSAGV